MTRKKSRGRLTPLAREYYKRYIRFSEQLHNAWIHFEVQSEILHLAENRCKDKEYLNQVFWECSSPVNPERRAKSRLRGKNLPGIIRRAKKREIPESVLLNSLALFEAFVTDIAKVAYVDNPKRFLLRGDKHAKSLNDKEDIKLLEILIDSSSREEVIERHVEERLRGVFYENPVKVFTTNRLGFNLEKTMKGICEDEIDVYAEIVARRNVIVHNLGKIDRKYLREVKNTSFQLGDEVSIDRDYLFKALYTLNTLAKKYVNEVAISTTPNHKKLPHVKM